MAAPRPAGGLPLLRLRLAGVGFLAVLAGLVGLTVLLYNKAFTDVVTVTLQAERIGNQLSAPADVKVRGLIVGTVRDVSTTSDGARVELALQPDKVDQIPQNVEARLLPKTLFGEKFVDLVIPAAPSGEPIGEGDVIPEDRSETAIETARVLDDLLPLLQALKPDDLSATLGALSTALRDRGDRIGANAVLVDGYLKQLNPELPAIQRNLVGLADLADTYDDAAPDFLAVLDDLSFSSRSLVDQREELARFLETTTGFSDSTESFLRDNRQRLIDVANESLPALSLFAQYSPEFPCVLTGLADYQAPLERTFGGGQPGLHITLEVTRDNGAYERGRDEPAFLEDRPANCMGLPFPNATAPGQAPDVEFKDGYRDEERRGIGAGTFPGGGAGTQAQGRANPAALFGGERGLIDAVVAPVMGVPVDEVPDLATLLFGPIARGATVGLATTPGGTR